MRIPVTTNYPPHRISMTQQRALLVLDLINEIIHPNGKVASHGYAEQVQRRHVVDNAAAAIAHCRSLGIPVIYVIVGFSESYVEWPSNSPIFFDAKERQTITLGTWATEVHERLTPLDHEPIVVKHRVSPFFQTNLELILRQLAVDTLLLVGVSTEFVILSTAREAHDRDFTVVVLEDATAASSDEMHNAALAVIKRTAVVCTVDDALPRAESC